MPTQKCYVHSDAADGSSFYTEGKYAPHPAVQLVQMLIRSHPNSRDLYISPCNASIYQIRGLLMMTVTGAGLAPFRDKGLLFAKAMSEVRYVASLLLHSHTGLLTCHERANGYVPVHPCFPCVLSF
ncbi:hypothetical protein BKA63DRAFT_292288 [Paraphoma chrysanthemicola]|nr:hypothetical protein BKA63DRAFT_292288 [Paraphoma chrysanthemicola]